ncbi:MAG: LCP family protein [Bariatricus sp.]
MEQTTENRRSRKTGVYMLLAVLIFAFLLCACGSNREKGAAEAAVSETGLPESSAESVENGRIEYQGKKYRRNTYVKAILCMGVDRMGTLEETQVAGSGGQADGIFLIAQDTFRNRVRILLIPRDTMTQITLTDLRGNVLGKDTQHLTLAFAYGDGREKSCQYMEEAVSHLLYGLEINGYIAMNMEVLPILNDAVGGVSVTIEDEELEKVNPAFTQGKTVVLQGEEAEQYVRYRNIDRAQSALIRMERQKSYIQGFSQAVKAKSRQEEGLAARLFDEVQPYMVTDMSKGQYMDIVLDYLSSNQDLGEGDMLSLPGKGVETAVYDEFYPDEEEILPLILDLFYRVGD